MMAGAMTAAKDGRVFFSKFVSQHHIAMHASVDKGR